MNNKRSISISTLILLSLAGLCGAAWFDFSARQIVVVTGTTSVKDNTERVLAKSLAVQTSAWLDELGLQHKRIPDEDVTPWRLRSARAVILPYNPYPSPLELKAFESVLKSGGILLVFYGMDPSLAALMQVKLGAYRKAEAGHPWKGFIFDTSAIPGLPEKIDQTSDHLVPVIPGSGAARVIARWTDNPGRPTAEPAWIRSPSGFWMSHVLQPGNNADKKQMLLAMLATAIPDAWQKATAALLSPLHPFGEYASLREAESILGYDLSQIRRTTRENNPDSYRKAKEEMAALTRLYASRQPAGRSPFIRAIWLDDSSVAGPDAWPALAASLTGSGINTIFVRVGNPLALRDLRDLFPPGISAAHPHQPSSLHAWLPCMNIENSTADQLARLQSENRLQVSDTGVVLPWLCPSHPANRLLLADAATTLARSGVFGGIHLDYIRCKNSSACFCQGCRKRFEEGLGHAVERWPADARTGTFASTYRQWRAEQITACVAATRDAVKAANPTIKLSAAVYGATPSCYATVGQDWPGWLGQGLLDFACPMNYSADLKTFSAYLETQSRLPSRGRIVPGIGASSSLSTLTPDQAVAQAILIRRAGFPGFAVFEFTSGVQRDVLPLLNSLK